MVQHTTKTSEDVMRDWRVEFADGTTCYVSNADMHGVADYLAMRYSKLFHRVDAVM